MLLYLCTLCVYFKHCSLLITSIINCCYRLAGLTNWWSRTCYKVLLSLDSVNNIWCYNYYNYYGIDFSCTAILLMSQKGLACGYDVCSNINSIVITLWHMSDTCLALIKILLSSYLISDNNLIYELSNRIMQVVLLPIIVWCSVFLFCHLYPDIHRSRI